MATRPVLVGVDGSEESLRAVEWAARQAKRRRSPLRIVSAPAMPPRMRGQVDPVTVANALRGMSAQALAAALTRSEEVAPGLPVDTGLLSGPPAVALSAAGGDASMLVVGARGIGGFTAMILGSVSRYVAAHAACPVIVVRQETSAVHREIAVGIRDTENGTAALAFAFEEAALRDADLVAVHASAWFPAALRVPDPGGAIRQVGDIEEILAEATSHLAAMLAGWRDKYPAVRIRQDVVRGHPARVLASYSARADLVVLGRHGGPAPGSAGVGSVQHAVLNHAHGPVAIVPADTVRSDC
jgi:nucleotide-binding universal stress UspA family protein